MKILLICVFIIAGWVDCYWHTQTFFARLNRTFPNVPPRRLQRKDAWLFLLFTIPVWPLVSLGLLLIDPHIAEPVGTKRVVQ